jgi:FdhE protein
MMTAGTALDDLKRRRQEWAPWLAVVEEVLRESGASTWDAAVPAVNEARPTTVPLLAGTTLRLPGRSVRRFLARLIRIASLGGTSKMATLRRALDADLDVPTLFSASLCQDNDRVKGLAETCGADAEALQAVTALLSVPLLHACARRFAPSINESWVQGYCPVCGSWPAFAEVRGIERSRVFRCGRCDGAWHSRALFCPYCDMADHEELVELLPEKTESSAAIDACNRCRGYVKTLTRLQACPPGTVMLEDLASVELDVAALEQGFTRPPDAGYVLELRVTEKAAARRFFGWKS